MARVKRGGRELVIADSEVTEYLKSGYSVIDEHGNELTPAKAMTYNQVLSENGVLKKRVESLNKQLEAANREIADMKAAVEQAEKKAETAPDNNPPTETPIKAREVPWSSVKLFRPINLHLAANLLKKVGNRLK